MTTVPPEKIVIFDYSGTLSPGAPLFGQPENLIRELRETGLAALGVSTPEVFWNDLVNPTWNEGSTTQKGYRKVLAERIADAGLAPGASPAEIDAAVSRFVASYLDHSRIDPHWRALLERLSVSPDTAVLIATDHYAEATEAIIRFLAAWNIPTVQSTGTRHLSHQHETAARSPCIVANSADLGFWKEDGRFWKTLKERFFAGRIRRAVLIDDFGFNESMDDGYGARAKIDPRREKTRTVVGEVFQVEPEIISFFLETAQRKWEDARGRLIAKTAALCEKILLEVPQK